MINFCLKETILNYFELPVVVICCFGTQSAGKSTFLNEFTGSFFDVSGMRCTEGIWMNIKLFYNEIKKNERHCNRKCRNCNINNCYLWEHKEEDNCLCENCICGKECYLYNKNIKNKNIMNCDLKCCLKKGHEELIECSLCDCKCICKCTCSGYNHNHYCKKCQQENNTECNCECNCKHFCRYPILLHNFICISLDFEGLGTFERSIEQDIQMALIGSAMGNIVIFRTGNALDKFIDMTLEKLSLGSRRIKSLDSANYFGGSLCFCPRDVIKKDEDSLYSEFSKKMDEFVSAWLSQTRDINKKYNIFGLFDDHIFSPTPTYQDYSFYQTLRNILVKDMIDDSFKLQRHPIYKTGKEFYSNLKKFLSAVYINEFDFLSNIKEDEIRNYINEKLPQAFEIIGVYENILENKSILVEKNKLKYFNHNFISQLETNFLTNNKFENVDTLIIDNIVYSDDIEGKYELEEYEISFAIKKTGSENYSMTINNLNDFGLILKIPDIINNKINYDDICLNFYKIWENICKEIKFKERDIINSFQLFISAIIKRRNNNVLKWLTELIQDYPNIKYLQNQTSPLDNIWIICQEKCSNCFYKCTLLQGHTNKIDFKKHLCPYDHKCKNECLTCISKKCNNENCKGICDGEADHPGEHKCKHKHSCPEKCFSFSFTRNCKEECIKEFGHTDKHHCSVEIHYCNVKCSLKEISRNCAGNCNKIYPHEGEEHLCGSNHKCKNECDLKNKADGCQNNGICDLDYGHKEEHRCGAQHICKEVCSKNKAKNCKTKCALYYPHKGIEHDCKSVHKCNEKCYLNEIAGNCKINCDLDYGHKENHNCGRKHTCLRN